jgi:hypothetical protein
VAHGDLLEVGARYATTDAIGPAVEGGFDRWADADRTPPDVVVCDELAYLVAAARSASELSHCNHVGLRYYERKDVLARLRGALIAYDRARGVV